MGKHNFKFNVDVNVINHLGVGLYSSTPAALTELVANAWDADANYVEIYVNPAQRTITIEDDGHGMSADDVQNKFLKVGYSRRVHSKNKFFSDSGKRRVMGRKGIGKLAIFALADEVVISSKASGGEAVGFRVDVPEFKKNLEKNQSHPLQEINPQNFKKGHGTRIELRRVLTGLDTTEAFLRVKLARRFSVLDDGNDFKVVLNKKEITKADRGFYQHVQFLWTFDETSEKSIVNLAKNLSFLVEDDGGDENKTPCVERLGSIVSCGVQDFEITGYVASVFQPRQLGAKEDSANMLSVFANGRVFAEDVLPEANSAKYYQSYLVGEIHANFLDDDEVDRATASREAIKKDDPKYKALIGFVRSTLDDIGSKWDEWRIALGLDGSDPQNAAVLEWIDTLVDKRDKRTATKLMTSIKNAVVHSDPIKNDEAKKVLYRGAIIGFEKLRLRNQLDKLAQVTDILGAEFAAIFATLDQVEESSYAEITRQRLEIIKKFAEICKDPSTLEKVAHKYLFEHLWLLDPTWDRVTGRAEMEKTLTEELKKKHPDSTGARLDISYRASSGRHVVVELKKPTKTALDYDELFQQVRKYKRAVEAYYEDKEPNKPIPPLDIYLLVAKRPNGFSESDRQSLDAQNGRLITYEQLINDARNAYQQYLDVNKITLPLEGILKRL